MYYFISDNKSQAVKKPVYHDWTIDHVKTCIVSFHSSILTAFTRLACDLISVCLTQLNCWHLNIENRILVSDCHRWSVLLNNTIFKEGGSYPFGINLLRLLPRTQSDERSELLRISLQGKEIEKSGCVMLSLSTHNETLVSDRCTVDQCSLCVHNQIFRYAERAYGDAALCIAALSAQSH